MPTKHLMCPSSITLESLGEDGHELRKRVSMSISSGRNRSLSPGRLVNTTPSCGQIESCHHDTHFRAAMSGGNSADYAGTLASGVFRAKKYPQQAAGILS